MVFNNQFAVNHYQYRPDYYGLLLRYCLERDLIQDKVVGDIGCGTGRLAQIVAPVAKQLYAVEPSVSMFEKCKTKCAGYDNIIFLNQTMEKSGILDHTLDTIVFAQSFHLMDAKSTERECRRTAKKFGKVVLSWYQKKIDITGFYEKHHQIFCDCCTTYPRIGSEVITCETFDRHFQKLLCFDMIPFEQVYTRQDYLGLCLSADYSPTPTSEKYQIFLEKLNHLFQEFQKDGVLHLPYTLKIFVGSI